MGYLTKHIINIIPDEQNTEENLVKVRTAVADALGEPIYESMNICSFNGTKYINDRLFNYGFGSKWYHNEQMLTASKKIPEFKIRLRYLGENGDAFDEVYENGKRVSSVEISNTDDFKSLYLSLLRYS